MKGRSLLSVVSLLGVLLLVVVEAFGSQLQHLLSLDESGRNRFEVGLLAAVVLVVINLVFHLSVLQAEDTSRQIQDAQRSMATEVRALEGRLVMLSSEDLYHELSDAIDGSRSRIYTAYMGESPPTGTTVRSKKQYFGRMLSAPKKKSDVIVRRLVLGTRENGPWIKSLVRAYEGMANVSVAVYERTANRAPLLSIQLFDDDRIFLVHVASRPPGRSRDIKISSKEVVSLMDSFYEEMWGAATILLDAGVLRDSSLSDFLMRVGSD